MRVYFDNAATTPILPEIIQYIHQSMMDNYGNPSSIHAFGRNAKAVIEAARRTVSKAINASLGEIFFTSSATESNNMVLRQAVEFLNIKHIISSPTEHHCVLHTLEYLNASNRCQVTYLNVDKNGSINMEELEQYLKVSGANTLVSLMHGNNEIGTIHPIDMIGDLCFQYGSLFHCDAVQTIGKINVDVQKSRITFLSGSGHKLHGPKGIGFVYINNNYMIPPMILGGAQERNMRAGTENVVSIGALGKAIEYNLQNREHNQQLLEQLRSYFKQQIQSHIDNIEFNGNQEKDYLAHIINVSFPPAKYADLLIMNLDIEGVAASAGSACSAGIEEDSHVIQAIGHPKDRKSIRFSFSHFNTTEEVDYVIEKIVRLCK